MMITITKLMYTYVQDWDQKDYNQLPENLDILNHKCISKTTPEPNLILRGQHSAYDQCLP